MNYRTLFGLWPDAKIRDLIETNFMQVERGQPFYSEISKPGIWLRKFDDFRGTCMPPHVGRVTLRPGDKVLIWDSTIGIKQGHCPDCGSTVFLEGPRGGLSVNIRCNFCGSEFGFQYPFASERIYRNAPGLYHSPFILAEWIKDWDQALTSRMPAIPNGTLPVYGWVYILISALYGSWCVAHRNWGAFLINNSLLAVVVGVLLYLPSWRYKQYQKRNEKAANSSPGRMLSVWRREHERRD
jgi:hypothetical protein